MKYYVNTFNIPNTNKRHFAIWQIEPDKESSQRYLPGVFKWYKWIKEIYDPHGHFKKNYRLDVSKETIADNEHSLIKKIFDIVAEFKAIDPKVKITL